MDGRVLDYVALGILITVAITFLYAIIYIHDIPYKIAQKRNHPHVHAIHTAGWVSLFLMHALWPFLWIWATLYSHEEGWGLSAKDNSQALGNDVAKDELVSLKARVATLEEKLNAIPKNKPQSLAEEA
ncbi:MAG: hypothetical protein ACI8ZB_002079 [Desulforhopalus sp.]|jgi:hypothetical protein